jgi:cytochrome c biogenesis protein CcmG/thiol:disulfide interchange protein DsbE
MSRKLTLALVILASVALMAVLYAGFGRDPRAVPFMLQGQPAPAFSLVSLESGQPVTLESLRGRPIVMNFWASWCGPCKSEHPVLEWGARALKSQAQFVGVVFEDTEENARAFLSRYGASFQQLIDPRGTISVDFGVAGVPETYFIDAKGTITGKHVGPMDQLTLAQRVRELAAAPSAPSARP